MKKNIFMEAGKLYLITIICAFIAAFVLYGCTKGNGSSVLNNDEKTTETQKYSDSENKKTDSSRNFIVTIDPGHGGFDPGKVSSDGILEKDINLEISLMLKEQLEEMGFTVYMTRENDSSLNDSQAGNKKMSDLMGRISFASEKKSDLLISIHQNSFSGASVCGAQVFYYSTSNEGCTLAELIQDEIKNNVDTTNKREVKGNSEYLLLAKSTCTSVIVECGFLSNADECEKLCSSKYQELIAHAISNAVLKYYDGL